VPLGENGAAVSINPGDQVGSGLGLRYPLELAFAALVRRVFCEHVEHFEEALSACGAGEASASIRKASFRSSSARSTAL
jgi:hypothetical protein